MTRKSQRREEDLHLEAALSEMVAVETGRQALETPEFVAPMDDPDIAGIRKSLGFTQAGLAERLEIPIGTLRNWEQGRRKPSNAGRLLLGVLASTPPAATDPVPSARKGIGKSELIARVARDAGLPASDARKAVDAVFSEIAVTLRSRNARFVGFGNFIIGKAGRPAEPAKSALPSSKRTMARKTSARRAGNA